MIAGLTNVVAIPTRPIAMIRSFFAIVLFSGVASAQARSVKSWKCEFPLVVNARWEGAKAGLKESRQELTFNIDAANAATRTARMIGNAGSADLRMLVGDDRVTFLELTPTGNLNVTVIYDARQPNGLFRAVHSRHFSLPGDPGPSQQYGTCKRWE